MRPAARDTLTGLGVTLALAGWLFALAYLGALAFLWLVERTFRRHAP